MFEKVRHILASQLEIDEALITRSTNIIEDLGADSLDMVELLMALEEECQIIITDESANGLTTVGEVVDFIESQV